MLSDDEIDAIYIEHRGDGGPTAMCENFARALLAAHTAKLLAGVELPEPTIITDMDWCENETYDIGDLQQYAAAVAAQARVKALEQAMRAFSDCCAFNGASVQTEAHARQFIEKLKGGE